VSLPTVCLALVLAVLAWSSIGPADRFTWWLEVAPVLIGLAVLVPAHRRVRFTSLLLVLLTIHAAILCIGGHWTYAEVPFGFWMARTFGFARNHYDRIGHFAQGFVPAILAREVLVRWSPLAGSRWLPFVVLAISLATSAFYELVEWWAAVLTEGGATAFLGTQGDPWDTQWDMFLALAGACTALVLLSGAHDRALARVRDSA
jgi:putative membrane protein